MTTAVARSQTEVNSVLTQVYKNMFFAVLVSMLTSWWVSSNPALMTFLFSGLVKWLVIFAPLAAVFALTGLIDRMTKLQAHLALHGFAVLMGLSLSMIFAVFTAASIVNAFMGAATLFGVMAAWGHSTKRDLSGWGNFLLVGVIAVVIASVINIFLGSSVLAMTVSALAILIFTALTAYDSQRIREEIQADVDDRIMITGALSLYLNFINIFTSLLNLFGQRE